MKGEGIERDAANDFEIRFENRGGNFLSTNHHHLSSQVIFHQLVKRNNLLETIFQLISDII